MPPPHSYKDYEMQSNPELFQGKNKNYNTKKRKQFILNINKLIRQALMTLDKRKIYMHIYKI